MEITRTTRRKATWDRLLVHSWAPRRVWLSGKNRSPFGEPVITGGDGGAGIRHYDPSWVREICDCCVEAGIGYFDKQWGGRTPKAGGRILDGRTWDQLPHLGQSQERTLPL
jgi:Protein of unknown function (DUF5131)